MVEADGMTDSCIVTSSGGSLEMRQMVVIFE